MITATASLSAPITASTSLNTVIGTSPAGTAYNRNSFSGQLVSFTDGDDGYHYQIGTYSYTPPSYPLYFPRLSDFLTLTSNNEFGNTNRFTDSLGGTAYANKLMIDHFTGLMWHLNLKTSANWTTAISNIHGVTIQGFNDWRIPNIKDLVSVMNYRTDIVRPLRYEPWLTQAGSVSWSAVWTSQTPMNNLTRAYYFDFVNSGRVIYDLKTSTIESIICRNYG